MKDSGYKGNKDFSNERNFLFLEKIMLKNDKK